MTEGATIGLLVKQLLRHASEYSSNYQRIAEQTRSIVFLATPHSGADSASLLKKLWFTRPSVTIQELVARHPGLRDLNRWYRNHAPTSPIKTVVYRENKPIGGKLIVDEASSDPGLPGCDAVPLDEDHFTICKPRNRDAQVYRCVKQLAEEICHAQKLPGANRSLSGVEANPGFDSAQPADSSAQPAAASSAQSAGNSDEEQLAFENKIRERIHAALMPSHLSRLVEALAEHLKLSGDAHESTTARLTSLIEAWWQSNTITRIEILRDASKQYLDSAKRTGVSAADNREIMQTTKQILGWLALTGMSQAWLKQHRNQPNPYHDVPLRFVVTIELYVACMKDDLTISLSKPCKSKADVVGAGLIDYGEHGFFPETGWLPETAVEEIAKALWKLETGDEKIGAFTVEDDAYLTYLLVAPGRYLAIHKDNAKNHPLLLPTVRDLFGKRFKGVQIIFFGIKTDQEHEPLIVNEGTLVGAISHFFKIIEPYEHP